MDDIRRRYAVSVLFLSAVVFFSLLVSLNPDTANSLGGDLVAGSFALQDQYENYKLEATVSSGGESSTLNHRLQIFAEPSAKVEGGGYNLILWPITPAATAGGDQDIPDDQDNQDDQDEGEPPTPPTQEGDLEITSPVLSEGTVRPDVGQLVSFVGETSTRDDVGEYLWDLGIRNDPWGEVKVDKNGLFVCDNGNNAYAYNKYQTIYNADKTVLGSHCGPTVAGRPVEFNVYANNIRAFKKTNQPFAFNYTSFSQCGAEPHICLVQYIVTDKDGVLISRDYIYVELQGKPGDLTGDAKITAEDASLLYAFLTGEVDEVDGNADYSEEFGDKDGVNIHDYVLMQDKIAEGSNG